MSSMDSGHAAEVVKPHFSSRRCSCVYHLLLSGKASAASISSSRFGAWQLCRVIVLRHMQIHCISYFNAFQSYCGPDTRTLATLQRCLEVLHSRSATHTVLNVALFSALFSEHSTCLQFRKPSTSVNSSTQLICLPLPASILTATLRHHQQVEML